MLRLLLAGKINYTNNVPLKNDQTKSYMFDEMFVRIDIHFLSGKKYLWSGHGIRNIFYMELDKFDEFY